MLNNVYKKPIDPYTDMQAKPNPNPNQYVNYPSNVDYPKAAPVIPMDNRQPTYINPVQNQVKPPPNSKLTPQQYAALVEPLRMYINKITNFKKDKKLKSMGEGQIIGKKRRIVSDVTAVAGEIVNAKFYITNSSTLMWPDAYILSKQSGNINIDKQIFAVKLSPKETTDFTVVFRAPEKTGKYWAKLNFYYFDGQSAFVSFGKVIRINLVVSNANPENNETKLMSLAVQLSEAEGLGKFEDCFAAITACNGNIDQAREALLSSKGLLNNGSVQN